MSTPIPDIQLPEVTLPATRVQIAVSAVGLGSITVGTWLIGGWLSVSIALGTIIVWWRTTTPLALAALTIGLTAVLPATTPPIQFGVSVSALAAHGIAVVVLVSGMGILTIGSWLRIGTTPPLAGGWMLLPLGVGWLCVGGAAAGGGALWIVLALCGGLTMLGANAITQLTEYRLTATAGETAAGNQTNQ